MRSYCALDQSGQSTPTTRLGVMFLGSRRDFFSSPTHPGNCHEPFDGVTRHDCIALESVSQGSLMAEDPDEVCTLSGGVMWSCDATPIQPVTGWLPLSPRSFTRHPIFSCESLSLGRVTGLPRSAEVAE